MEKIGFRVLRRRDEYLYLRHPDGRSTTVPTRDGERIGPGLLALILRDCELWRRQLAELL